LPFTQLGYPKPGQAASQPRGQWKIVE
jgi:hypothetical protein